MPSHDASHRPPPRPREVDAHRPLRPPGVAGRSRPLRSRTLAGAVLLATLLGGVLGGCSDDDRTAAFCDRVAAADRLVREGDVTTLEQQAETFAGLRDAAPAEVRADVDLLADVIDDLARTVAASSTPEAGRDAVFTRRAGERERIEAAGRNLERYASERCGLTLNPTGAANPAPGTSAPAGTAGPGSQPGG